MRTHQRRRDDGMAARRDLAILGICIVLFAIASVHFELGERIASWTGPRERYQLDELPGVLVFLALGLAWFAWRRAKESHADVLRRRRSEAELVAALADNRRLEQESRRAQEEERRHLAREMHDDFSQYLNAVKVDATCLRSGLAPSQASLQDNAAAIIRAVDHLHGAVRAILQRLRPAGLDELGVAAAIEACVDEWRRRLPTTRFDVAVTRGCTDFGEAINMTLYRLAQEGLTNVAMHAHAHRVAIRVDRSDGGALDEAAVEFELSDDGLGARTTSRRPGLGLVGMRERVESLHGTFEAGDVAPHGFRIRATLPLAKRASTA
jgi:two-component system, NarL family, sensor histidine kinase UhpB